MGARQKKPYQMTDAELSAWATSHPDELTMTMEDALNVLLYFAGDHAVIGQLLLSPDEQQQQHAFLESWAQHHRINLTQQLGRLSVTPGKLEPLQ